VETLTDEWAQYARLVLDKLDTFDARLDRHDEKLETLLVAVAGLRVKASIWGALAGLIPACLALAYLLIK